MSSSISPLKPSWLRSGALAAPLLKQIVDIIPPDTFAPNLVISGAVAMSGVRILNLPVPHQGRRTGSVSIVTWKLWLAARRSFFQTVKLSASFDIQEMRFAWSAIAPGGAAPDAKDGVAAAVTGGLDVT